MNTQLDPAVRSKIEPHLASVARALGAENVLCYYSRDSAYLSSEDVQRFKDAIKHMAKDSKLAFILHTLGGDLKVAVDIIEEMRPKFKHVTAIVPVQAWSSGTLIALSCDRIIISEKGILSPTDPQANIPYLKVDLPLRDVVLAHEEHKPGKCNLLAHKTLADIYKASKPVYVRGLEAQEKALSSVPGRSLENARCLRAFFCEDPNKPHGTELGYGDICHLPLDLKLMEDPRLPPMLNGAAKKANDTLRKEAQRKDVLEPKVKFSIFVPFTVPRP